MDLDTFIDYLEQESCSLINIFVSYDKLYAELTYTMTSLYLNVNGPTWIEEQRKKCFEFPHLITDIEKGYSVGNVSLNPYHYSIIHTNFIDSRLEQLLKLKKIIEKVYVGLPSKVDIYRYKNDYDLYIFYL